MKAPCKGCKKRDIGCHSTCDEYMEWKRDHDKEVQLIRKSKGPDYYNRSTKCRFQ